MVSDSVLFAVIMFGVIGWTGLWLIELSLKIYNRCKRRARIRRRIAELGYKPEDHGYG